VKMGKHGREESGLSKEERKRKKKSRSETLQLETPSTTEPGTPASEAADEDATYKTNPAAQAVPQSDIDAFKGNEQVQVFDDSNSNLRPILDFSHLPVEIATQFASTFKTFLKPSAVQSATWPYLLSGRDVIGVAETGSGKTIAFGLPLVNRLANLKKRKGLRALVVAPTRELAIQVYEQINTLTKTGPVSLKAVCIYGGTNKDEQRKTCHGANIIVATPGRLKDFMNEGAIDVSKTKYLVLDEADRMLDKGFEDDIKQIIAQMPSSKKRQTAMFTATWPKTIRDLAATFMRSPVRITIGRSLEEDSGELRANTRIKQVVEVVDGYEKQNRLLELLKQHTAGPKARDRILIFALYKKEATRIENFIRGRGYHIAGIHGDMSQRDRIASLEAFKSGKCTLLVATDVAARGLDIPAVKLVINLTFPLTAEDYVHRIGRTGRAGADGLAITLFTEQDKGLAGALVNVLKAAGQEVPAELLKFGTTVKKKVDENYGNFGPREDMEGKTATKITFDD
jgi:ATP-dependent RNA helicase DBP3